MKLIPLIVFISCVVMMPVWIAKAAVSSSMPTSASGHGALVSWLDSPRAGARAPALTCKTTEGEPMSWASFDGRAVILFFHSTRTSNASQAIEQVAASLLEAQDLKERCTVVLIVDDGDAGRAAHATLSSTGFQVELGVAEAHGLHKSYRVVAYPTVYVIDGNARVVDSIRGFGTLFSFHALTACRFALGLIDRETFDGLISGERQQPNQANLLESRKYLMARRLITLGKREAALAILVEIDGEAPPKPRLIALIAHLQLLGGEVVDARSSVERLVKLEPGELDTTLLEARLALLAGEANEARSRLRGLDALDPRVEFVRGLILEREQCFEDAAAMYRNALSTSLFLPD